MYGEGGGFKNLSSIDFSGLSSLSSVGDWWLYGYNDSGLGGGFQNMKSINVGSVSFPVTNENEFCYCWPTGNGQTIYGSQANL